MLNFCSFAERDPGIATEETLVVLKCYICIIIYVHVVTYAGIASFSIHKLIIIFANIHKYMCTIVYDKTM